MDQSIKCVQAATEILGDKWTPQLIRCIENEQSVRFCQLQALSGNINPRTLSARLTMLEKNHIIERSPDDASGRTEYTLTQKGKDLLPILRDMQIWSQKYPVRSTAIA